MRAPVFPNSFESGAHALIVGFGPEIPAATVGVLVNFREPLPSKVRQIARDRAVGFTVVDALQRSANFEIAHFASVTVRGKEDLKIAVGVMAEAGGNTASPLPLFLSAGNTRLDALDEAAAFFFGDGGGDVRD